MNLDAYYDEKNGVVRLKIPPEARMDEKESPQFIEKLGKLFEGKKYRYLLCDASEGSDSAPENRFRRWISEDAASIGFDRIAVIGCDSATRTIARNTFAALGKSSKTQFFFDERSALLWLKRERSING